MNPPAPPSGAPAGTVPAAPIPAQERQGPGQSGYGEEARPRVGFFTDTSICIGCKACEVACKEWNDVPETLRELSGRSYDNTGRLGADAWRHVAFVEQRVPAAAGDDHADGRETDHAGSVIAPAGGGQAATRGGPGGTGDVRWLMSSDVCKHCTEAACLDVCPTGSLFRTEFGTVVVQEDICNGCGYCVPACPFGVLSRREADGRVWKCTMCYDRLRGGSEPACSQACPTNSIQFGVLDELRTRAAERVEALQGAGVAGARLYGHDPGDGVGGSGAFFLLLDDPEVYGLPPDPVATTRHLGRMWATALGAAGALGAFVVASFWGGGR